jgi:hypothetical protein
MHLEVIRLPALAACGMTGCAEDAGVAVDRPYSSSLGEVVAQQMLAGARKPRSLELPHFRRGFKTFPVASLWHDGLVFAVVLITFESTCGATDAGWPLCHAWKAKCIVAGALEAATCRAFDMQEGVGAIVVVLQDLGLAWECCNVLAVQVDM